MDQKKRKRATRTRRGRGEGSISQRADGLWEAKISLGYDGNGKRRRKTVYGKTKKEVQDKLLKFHTDVASGRPMDSDKLTVKAFLDRWLENTKKPAVGDTTFDRYEQHVRITLVPVIGSLRLAKLTKFDIEQMYADLEKNGVSKSEQHKAGKALRNALKHAVASDLIPKNPAALVPLPSTTATKRKIDSLEGDQAQRLLEAVRNDRLYALYVLALDSGMRQGELFGLQWPEVDFDRCEVLVQRSLKERKGVLELKETKTKNGKRRIKLTQATVDVLHDHRKRMVAEGNAAGPVFCDTEGKWLRKSNFIRRSFNAALVAAKLDKERKAAGKPKIRFHDLRHTCATLLLLEDVNVKIVSERLGHASIEITLNTYAHVLPTLQERAAEKLEAIIGQMLPKKAAG